MQAPGGRGRRGAARDGQLVGRLVRTRWPLHGTRHADASARVRIRGCSCSESGRQPCRWSPGEVAGWTARDVAARYSFVGTHLLISAHGTRFVSLLDGPDWADADTSACCAAPLLAGDGCRR